MKIQIIVVGGVVQDVHTDSDLDIEVEVIDTDDCSLEDLQDLPNLPKCIY